MPTSATPQPSAVAKIKLSNTNVQLIPPPTDKAQAFTWDTEIKGLAVRVTTAGARSFVFQTRINGKDARMTIGGIDVWSVKDARDRCRELQVKIDKGVDPRVEREEADAARVAEETRRRVLDAPVGQLWEKYLAEGSPRKKKAFSPTYLSHMTAMGSAGGMPKKRGKGLTAKGALHDLLQVKLSDFDADVVRTWFLKERAGRAGQAVKALRIMQGYLRWAGQSDKALKSHMRVAADACQDDGVKDSIPARNVRDDHIPAEFVGRWLDALDHIDHLQGAYLKCLVMLGCRREELARLKWSDMRKDGMVTVRDKVNGTRTIPIGQRVLSIIATLPRVNEFVFASTRTESGYMSVPDTKFIQSLKAAGVDQHVRIHGLRRTFSKLAEDAGAPTGVTAAIMGHSTKSIIEGYKPRTDREMCEVMDKIQAHIMGMKS